MTEDQWNACTDPQPMLPFLRGKASDRKLRLFACACCRRIWHLMTDEGRKAVEVAERYADGLAPPEELTTVFTALEAAQEPKRTRSGLASPQDYAESAALFATQEDFFGSFYHPAFNIGHIAGMAALGRWGPPRPNPHEYAIQALLLRDIIGNPFRPVVLAPAIRYWNDGVVMKVGQGIYDERAFDHLPILADALEEAGCTDLDVVNHCRQQSEHVRGCWVVDLVLGKK